MTCNSVRTWLCVIISGLVLAAHAQVADNTVNRLGHPVDAGRWAQYPTVTNLDMAGYPVVLGGASRTNWPVAAAYWSLYVARTNLNLHGGTLSNVASIPVGSVTLTNWSVVGSNWSAYAPHGSVDMGNQTLAGVPSMTLGGVTRATWPSPVLTQAITFAVYTNDNYTNSYGLYSNYVFVAIGPSSNTVVTNIITTITTNIVLGDMLTNLVARAVLTNVVVTSIGASPDPSGTYTQIVDIAIARAWAMGVNQIYNGEMMLRYWLKDNVNGPTWTNMMAGGNVNGMYQPITGSPAVGQIIATETFMTNYVWAPIMRTNLYVSGAADPDCAGEYVRSPYRESFYVPGRRIWTNANEYGLLSDPGFQYYLALHPWKVGSFPSWLSSVYPPLGPADTYNPYSGGAAGSVSVVEYLVPDYAVITNITTNTLTNIVVITNNKLFADTNRVDLYGIALSSTGITFETPMLRDLDMGGFSITNVGTDSLIFSDGKRVSSRGRALPYTPANAYFTGTYVFASSDPGIQFPPGYWVGVSAMFALDGLYTYVFKGGADNVTNTYVDIDFPAAGSSLLWGLERGDRIMGCKLLLTNCISDNSHFSYISAQLTVGTKPIDFASQTVFSYYMPQEWRYYLFGSTYAVGNDYITTNDLCTASPIRARITLSAPAYAQNTFWVDAAKLMFYTYGTDTGTNTFEFNGRSVDAVAGFTSRSNTFNGAGMRTDGLVYQPIQKAIGNFTWWEEMTYNPQLHVSRRAYPFVSIKLGTTYGYYTLYLEDEPVDRTVTRWVQTVNVFGTAGMAWSGNIIFAGGTPESITATMGAVDLFEFRWNGSKWVHMNSRKDIR